jgi:hypothetical protein
MYCQAFDFPPEFEKMSSNLLDMFCESSHFCEHVESSPDVLVFCEDNDSRVVLTYVPEAEEAAPTPRSAPHDAENILFTDGPSDECIRQTLNVDVTPQSCHLIRTIHEVLMQLHAAGIVHFERGPLLQDNSVWGFKCLHVADPLRFNQAFRECAASLPHRGCKPLQRPTEVFMKTMRFCGVSARRGTRGPRDTDPGPRDFMYSSFYDFVPTKEECMKRKMCQNGYSPELNPKRSKLC